MMYSRFNNPTQMDTSDPFSYNLPYVNRKNRKERRAELSQTKKKKPT